MADDSIIDDPGRHRYELHVGGQLAGHLDYRLHDGAVIELVHTEVARAFEGRGFASKIVQHALDDARAHGRKVIASCEYVAKYIGKHPQYRDLLGQA